MPDSIAILDFGSQYTQLIARRIRELHVYSELLPCDVSRETLLNLQPCGIILSGGPNSVYDPNAPALPDLLLDLRVPILGICYGMQLLAHALGGHVEKSTRREYGHATIQVDCADVLFADLPPTFSAWMSHGDQITALPEGFRALAHSDTCPFAAMADPARKIYALQFHPEVAHTSQGLAILRHFLFDVCGCTGDWTPAAFVSASIASIRAQVGKARVLCALSGGVDSTVTAVLVGRAIGKQLIGVFVDHGLLREGEARAVIEFFQQRLGLEIVVVEAQARFLEKLRGVVDPERKRKIIGAEFGRVFEETAAALASETPIRFLAQGTLYPDVIESRAPERPAAARIKTHHNVGGLPADLQFELLEPLRYLFKDEVRAVGAELGLPDEVIQRQPFPGPGLAIRILGEVTQDKLAILRAADAIVRAEIERAGWARQAWQYFAILTPLKTVGVMGDERTYENVIAVRAVTSADGMTADWARVPHEVLARISTRIVNEVHGVNRVVYDITSKPPGTIEWE